MTQREIDILRIAVLLRDAGQCVYCGAVDGQIALINGKRTRVFVTADHVLPRCWGGRNVPGNMVCACSRCNTIKATMDGETFAFMLKRYGFIKTRRSLAKRIEAATAKPIDRHRATKLYNRMTKKK